MPNQFNPLFDFMSEKASELVEWIYTKNRKKIVIVTSFVIALIGSLGCYCSIKIFGISVHDTVGWAIFLVAIILYFMFYVLIVGDMRYKRYKRKTRRF